VFDETAEWTYGLDDVKKDPSRCGVPSNPLLEKSSMSTVIKGSKHSFMNKLHNQLSMDHVERSLFHVFEHISRLSLDNGKLSSNIVEQAKYYYKVISERKLSRGDIRQGIIACCIMYACKYHNVSRSIKEISKMCEIKIPLLNKTNKIFIDLMSDIIKKDNLLRTRINTIDLIPRYCNSLELNKDIETRLIKMVLKLNEHIKNVKEIEGKTPSSVACAMILYLCKIKNINVNKKNYFYRNNK
jgi:transcription initiation factor TFIIB